MAEIPWLGPDAVSFPPLNQALKDPNGLIAAGGTLSTRQLLLAYSSGVFPWYDASQPILWWSPDPRAVLIPADIQVSRTLRKRLRREEFDVRLDQDFPAVVRACAEPREPAEGTWITSEMQAAYIELHKLGYAHSIECYQDGKLVGGLYGVSLGSLFFGESMFHRVTDASKVAFVHLARLMEQLHCPLIDCQVENPHLTSLGCINLPREQFEQILSRHVTDEPIPWDKLGPDLRGVA